MGVLLRRYGPFDSNQVAVVDLDQRQRTRISQAINIELVAPNAETTMGGTYDAYDGNQSGSFVAFARRRGGTLFEPLDVNPLDLAKMSGWPYTLDPVNSIRLEPSGLPSDCRYIVTVCSLDNSA